MGRNEECKQTNERGRERGIVVNFRMSPLEEKALRRRIRLSGRVKQDYMIQSTLYQKVVVVGDRRLAARIEERLDEIKPILKDLANMEEEELDPLIIIELRNIFEIVDKWKR